LTLFTARRRIAFSAAFAAVGDGDIPLIRTPKAQIAAVTK